jgi:hypothetical protein
MGVSRDEVNVIVPRLIAEGVIRHEHQELILV